MQPGIERDEQLAGRVRPAVGRGPDVLPVHDARQCAALLIRRHLARTLEVVRDPVLLRDGYRRMRLISPRFDSSTHEGQALTEFVLVFPLFLLVLFSLIVSGLYV